MSDDVDRIRSAYDSRRRVSRRSATCRRGLHVRARQLACAAVTAAPHDALFKAAFSQVEHAAEELRCVLPTSLLARMDLASLALAAGSFVDEALRESHTDLLYSLRLDGRDARIYILFEHQSTPDPWMPLRLLRYMLRIWDGCVADGATCLPVIIPVVLHHSVTGWRAPTRFEALFDLPPEAAAFTPHFTFALDDLGAHSEAALHKRRVSAFTRLVLSALQQTRSERDLGELLRGWAKLIRELRRAPDGARALRLVFRYLYEVRGRAEFAAVDTTARDPRESEDLMETMADYLRSEGRAQGLEQGREEGLEQGQRKFLLRLLEARFGELSPATCERVRTGNDAELERWGTRLLRASSLDDVFQP